MTVARVSEVSFILLVILFCLLIVLRYLCFSSTYAYSPPPKKSIKPKGSFGEENSLGKLTYKLMAWLLTYVTFKIIAVMHSRQEKRKVGVSWDSSFMQEHAFILQLEEYKLLIRY